ncbi:MAG: GDSL-type esterase/lipase family protein [Opitutaceae bacterium]|jgi:rhamnogalacturonan endolyase|nr:GDSL-type esterase/lipase family protein [Opitutaceae bacterium]
MKKLRLHTSALRAPGLLALVRLLTLALLPLLAIHALPLRGADAPVTLAEDADTYTLANGIVTARVAKASGDLVSLRYNNLEMLATFLTPDGEPDLQRDPPGANPNGLNPRMTDHQYGFWSHDAMGPRGTAPAIARVTIDPRSNGGERAEVSVKGIADGRKMGTGPGASPDGQFASDVEIRFTLGRGDPGVYTYSTFEHRPEQPQTAIGEARFCAKLADFFDWMSVDARRNLHFPKELRAGDKYIYTALQSANPAFGWSSTAKKVGLFFINPSMEYMSGGPTKVEFLGHRDTNAVAAPCVLNYWRSSHYGGARVEVAAGERWSKVVGPFLIYVNSGDDPQAIYADAKARAAAEAGKWPYAWVRGVDYPSAAERVTVKGRLVLRDENAPTSSPSSSPTPPAAAPFTRLSIGLTAPDNDWQRDAKNYQFWATGAPDGAFAIPHVRPGRYTLRAIADGVLGEFAKTDITVEPGKPLDLGALTWTPVRRGRQLWDIGIPNRNASEFFMSEKHDDPEISIRYAALFPDDIRYTVGKSAPARDWFFQHVPHSEDPAAKSSPFRGAVAPGRAAPRTIAFDMPAAPKGRATLRLAICGTGARAIDIAVNGQPAGKIDGLPGDGTITRHGTQGIWYEREFAFDAALLRAGENTLVLTIPAGPVNNGMMYDYLRLELDETATRTLFIAGDSTAANGNINAIGWGKMAGDYFDPAKIAVVNLARGGRSSRTFITEGHWDRLLEAASPGDIVLIQFGHNDGSEINHERRARGSLPGLGEETQEIDNKLTKQHETVHTFGWYMRKMVADARAKGMWPALLTLTVRNYWKDGRVERGSGRYDEWIRQIAESEKVPLVDHTRLIADRYEQLGHEEVNAFFPNDHVHTSAAGARLNAALAVSGLKGLREQWLIAALSHAGRQIPVAAPSAVLIPPQPPPQGVDRDEREIFGRWLNLPVPADPRLPTIWLIGDSTVRNGRGTGYNKEFGWGDPFAKYFYPARVNVVNRAVGGTGARTFHVQWSRILPQLKAGDVVIMQFGHNDNGARGALRGTGDETEQRENPATKQSETVHTFGWYLKQYIAEIREKGAHPVICSLVPRNRWTDGKVGRGDASHGGWARTAAEETNTPFIDLNSLIADYYDTIGQEQTSALFADKTTHTNWDGAVINAQIVARALRALPDNPTAAFMRPGM